MSYRQYTEEQLIKIFGDSMGRIVYNQTKIKEQYDEEQREKRVKYLEYMKKATREYRARYKLMYGINVWDKRV